jgi:hypothetical protein
MKTGKSLQQLAAELERQVETRKDCIASQGKLEAVVNDGAVELAGFNGRPMAIRPYAHKQLADVLSIPTRYYERMAAEQPHLLAANINTWLHDEPEAKRMIRTLDGQVRAVLSPRYRPLDNFDLASVVLPKLLEVNAQVVSADLTETRLYIKAILPDLSDSLPKGMVWGNGHNAVAEYGSNEPGRVVAAIVVSNSEVGAGTLRVEPSVFTTWCTNLAIMKAAAMRKYHVGRAFEADENLEVFRDETRQANDRAFFLKVADVTAAAFDRTIFQAAVAEIREAAERDIESEALPRVVDMAVKELALPPASSSPILNWLARGGDLTQWGLASAITATSATLSDYESATQFERAGGELLSLGTQEWSKISRAA